MPLPKINCPCRCRCRLPEWLKNPEYLAKGYSYVYLLLSVYQAITFWYDVRGFWHTWRYILIYIGFVVPSVVLGFILLIAVHKRELQKTWIWWLLEIVLLALFLTLFLVGIHGLSIKTVLVNLILHGALRILGLKIIYDYMLFLSDTCENGNGLNRVDVKKSDGNNDMSENGSGLRFEVRKSSGNNSRANANNTVSTNPFENNEASTNPFENVPLDDPWSGQEKL